MLPPKYPFRIRYFGNFYIPVFDDDFVGVDGYLTRTVDRIPARYVVHRTVQRASYGRTEEIASCQAPGAGSAA